MKKASFLYFFEFVEISFFRKNEFDVAYGSCHSARRRKHGFVGKICAEGENYVLGSSDKMSGSFFIPAKSVRKIISEIF